MSRDVSLLALVLLALQACSSDGILDLFPEAGSGGDAGGDATLNGDAPTSDVATDSACFEGGCPCGLTACGTQCIDLLYDPFRCGSCTATGCTHHGYCNAGQCACLPGLRACGGSCIDTKSDPDNCGGCGNAPCTSGQRCETGSCLAGTTCGGGLTACPIAGGAVACVDFDGGLPFCGTCGRVCSPEEVCVNAGCYAYAPATPCSACPCDVDCSRAVGSPASCCPGISGGPPICIAAGPGCP